MSRTSAFRGTWQPNKRPYVVLTPDTYISIQGQTSVIACGECRREIDINRYLTGVQTDASVESPPGSSTITLSVPDNDINQFYVDGNLVIISMMEIEIFAKGYYTVGGFPQYYRIFWGMVSSVSKSWSNGVTTITLNCKDILRWWEITNINLQPAFLDASKSMGGWSLFQNRFAGMNPYVIIITLAKEAMGDFSITNSSFTSFRPEDGPERRVIAQYAKDIMAYWQLKFGNIWNNLVLYGTSGQAYTFTGSHGDVSPLKIAKKIFEAEDAQLNLNPETSLFKIQPFEIAAFKRDISRAGDVDFFQNEIQSKLSVALTARDQAGAYEFYCDTTGDIVFKPPFYNLNVLPNKPVSWIQDFEIIEDNITDSEQEVYTHITSSGNAFGGTTDWGLNDEITTPRTGVIDWHLLKRYGWRHLAVQLEWAGNPKKLFYYLLDYMDRINARRTQGSITIPMRPELRMGFPIWIPKYDSFFYVQGISHSYAPGGQAVTHLTLIARRQKFIAPKDIGLIVPTGQKHTVYTDPVTKEKSTRAEKTFTIKFPSNVGQTSGLTSVGQDDSFGGPAILRDPKTGKLLGFPNAVMVYRTTLSGQKLAAVLQQSGSKKGHKPGKQDKKRPEGADALTAKTIQDTFIQLQNEQRADVIDRLRIHRYEAGMSNAGAYDYAHDIEGIFKEFAVIPTHSIMWGTGTVDPDSGRIMGDSGLTGAETFKDKKDILVRINANVKILEKQLPLLRKELNDSNKLYKRALLNLQKLKKTKGKPSPKGKIDPDVKKQEELVSKFKVIYETASKAYADQKWEILDTRANKLPKIKLLSSLSVMVRPVSDEFGFEVIGHNRYGRGAFIDRGHVQLHDKNKNVVNKLNIQFAAMGGLLTDPTTQNAPNLGPESHNFSEAFERMQPDDYITGASFKGSNYSYDQQLEQVNPTGQETYTNLMKSSPKGTAVFAEADALKRAVTLAELKPTMSNGLDAAGFSRCGCQLGRTNWLSVLPQSFISQVLHPVQATAGLTESSLLSGVPTTITIAEGNTFSLDTPGGFFDILRTYLVDRFNSDYKENKYRESYAINGGIDNVVPDLKQQDNTLGVPKNSLFNRASQGDPDALAAMEKGANFNFGQTKDGLQNFKDTVEGQKGKVNQLNNSLADLPGSIFNAASGGLSKVGKDGKLEPAISVTKGPVPQHQPPVDFPTLINPSGGGVTNLF